SKSTKKNIYLFDFIKVLSDQSVKEFNDNYIVPAGSGQEPQKKRSVPGLNSRHRSSCFADSFLHLAGIFDIVKLLL
ncbi:MAG: hypothetical protein LBS02_05030, partial [Hungatella sp.]|nr:hypothetical protein [Hungatella sp.]